MTNATAPTLLASPTPTAGDTLLRVDGTPLTTLTLASILDQIGTTAILPIIDSSPSPSSTSTTTGDTIDPGWKVRGFVRIETFMPKEMEFEPGFPARVQAFQSEQQHRLERQLAAREQAKVEAETLALRAAEAQTMLDTQKHELAMQENKRKTLEEGQKHELAKTAVEKAAVQNEIARKRQGKELENRCGCVELLLHSRFPNPTHTPTHNPHQHKKMKQKPNPPKKPMKRHRLLPWSPWKSNKQVSTVYIGPVASKHTQHTQHTQHTHHTHHTQHTPRHHN